MPPFLSDALRNEVFFLFEYAADHLLADNKQPFIRLRPADWGKGNTASQRCVLDSELLAAMNCNF